MEVNDPGRQKIAQAIFLAAGEFDTCMAILILACMPQEVNL